MQWPLLTFKQQSELKNYKKKDSSSWSEFFHGKIALYITGMKINKINNKFHSMLSCWIDSQKLPFLSETLKVQKNFQFQDAWKLHFLHYHKNKNLWLNHSVITLSKKVIFYGNSSCIILSHFMNFITSRRKLQNNDNCKWRTKIVLESHYDKNFKKIK